MLRKLNRRQFTQEASLAFLAGVSVTMAACGGGSGGGSGGDYGSPTASSTPQPSTASSSKTGQISDNHGHQAVITSAQLQAGGAVALDIAYQAGHSHTVNLPTQALQEIKDGKPVQTNSSTAEGHMHSVTFNADAPEAPSRY